MYEKVDSTRTRQLNKVIERIKLDEEIKPDGFWDVVAVIAPTSGTADFDDDDGVIDSITI